MSIPTKYALCKHCQTRIMAPKNPEDGFGMVESGKPAPWVHIVSLKTDCPPIDRNTKAEPSTTP